MALRPGDASGGTFLFVGGGSTGTCTDPLNGGGSNCIFGMNSPSAQQQIDTAAAAHKFVQKSQQSLDVTTFLLSPGLLNPTALTQLTPLATAIQQAGLQFYVDQRWTFRNAIVYGVFTCSKYITDAVLPNLLPLKTQFPDTFAGVAYDEPAGADTTNMALFSACWRSVIPAQVPALAGMKVFVNLLPTYAEMPRLSIPTGDVADRASSDCATLYPVPAGTAGPIQLSDYPNSYNYLSSYCQYAHAIARVITPDYLAFDSYPTQSTAWANSSYPGNTTTDLRDFMLGENYKIVSAAARTYSSGSTIIHPVSYTQDFAEFNQSTSAIRTPVADFNMMRWHAALGYAYGFIDYANFLSHSYCDAPLTSPCANWVSGFFNSSNNEDLRTFATADPNLNPWTMYASGMPGVLGPVKTQLAGYVFLDTVFPHQGVLSGSAPGYALGWLPSPNLVAGEYKNTATGQNMIIFANRNYGLTIPAQVASFSFWVRTVEKFDFFHGIWVKQNTTSTNSVTFSETSFPFSMIRLTP